MIKALKNHKWYLKSLILFALASTFIVVGLVVKTKISQAQACSGCRNAAITVNSMANGADAFTVVGGTFAGGFYKSGSICYPRQFSNGTMTYRVLTVGGVQVYPSSGYATLPDSMNQVHAGSSYNAGAITCTNVQTNMYTYEYIATVPTNLVATGQYLIEIGATSVYSGNTSTVAQDTSVSVVTPATTVQHGFAGQLILSGIMGTYGDTIIRQNDTASWNLVISCTNYSGKVNLDVSQPFSGVTLQWYNGAALLGSGATLSNRDCGEAITLKMVTGSTTSPLNSAQPVQVCLSSPTNGAMANCGGQPNFTILGQPKINTFTANPTAVVPGGTTQVSWTTQNVSSPTTGCAQSVTSGSATGWSSTATTSSGTNVRVTINSVPTVLVLTCYSPDGTTPVSKSITITSSGDFSFNMAPTAYTQVGGSFSQSATLNCVSPFAGPVTNINIQSTISGITSYQIIDQTSGLSGAVNGALATASCGDVLQLNMTLSSNALPVSWSALLTPVTVNLVGTASGVGTKVGGGFNLTIYANPIVILTSSAIGGAVGSSPTLTWSSIFAGSCNASGGSSGWAGSKSTSGNQTLPAINSVGTYTYTLQCYNYVYSTSANVSYTTSNAKIEVDLQYDGTPYTYPAGAPQRSIYYYIIDRTTGTVILPQAMYYQPQQITNVIPGHQYQLVYNSGWLGTADYGGAGNLFKKASPFITDLNGADMSAPQTLVDGQTLKFRLNWQNVGNVSSGSGQGCLAYYYTSSRYSNMDLWSRLAPTDVWPQAVTTNGQLTGSGQLTADEPTYYTPQPSSNFNSSFGSVLVSVNWKAAAVNLREAPGWYYYWMVSTTMSGYCSTIAVRLQVDPPTTPTYGFTAAPVSLNFTAQQNGSLPAIQDVNITGTGNQATPINASGASSWLTVNPTTMTLSQYTQYMHFQPNTTNLPVGNYSNVVRIMDTRGNYYNVTVNYTITATSASCPVGAQVQLSSSFVNVGSTVTASAPTPGVGFTNSSYSTPDNLAGYASLADLNGDGWLDMVVTNNNVGSISVYLNNGDGTYGSPTNYSIGLYTGVVRIVDLNADGKPDLAVSNTDNSMMSRTSILINNGSGGFGSQTDYYSQPSNVFGSATASQSGLVVADFNGDGKQDILYASWPLISNGLSVDSTQRTIVVRLGVGNGTFGAEQVTLTTLTGQDAYYAFPIVTGDFNGDGKQDVVMIYNGTGSFWVYNGLGNGKFGTGTHYITGNAWDVATADLNNDGKLDLVTADLGYVSGGGSQSNGTTATVYLNNGNGTFTNSGSYTTGSQPNSVAIGDINGDGKLDIAVLNNWWQSNNVSVLLGTGTGSFGAATNFSYSPEYSGQKVVIGDIDNDGRLDILTVGGGATLVLLKNKSSIPPIPVGASYSGGTYTSGNTAMATVSGTTVTALDGRPASGIVYISATGLNYSVNGFFASGCNLNPTPLYIRDFNVVSTGNVSVLQGITANLGYKLISINGFANSIALSNSGAPSTPGPVTMSPSGSVSTFPSGATVTVPTSGATNSGDYTVRASGTYNGITRTGNSNLNVTTPKTVDLQASKDNSSWTDGPLTVGYNVAPYLKWSSVGVSSCTVTGNSGSWSGTSNASQQAGVQTTSQTYNISCDSGVVSDSVTVNVYNSIPTNVNFYNTGTDASVPCGQVKITWVASSGANSYKLYRNTVNNTGAGLTEVDAQIVKTGTSYTYTPPDSTIYYYFVTALDGSNNASNYSASSTQNSGRYLSCSVDLSTSDIELISFNNTNNTPTPTDCDRNTQPLSPAPGLLRRGNSIVFKVNICNSGAKDFNPTQGNPLQITVTLANMIFSEADQITYSCGGCTHTYTMTHGSGTAPDSVVFNLYGVKLPEQSGGNPSAWSVSFTSTTRTPANSASTIFRFNNRADIVAGQDSYSYSTPYYFFYYNQANPIIKEVGH